jgi:phage I-like protein
MALVCLSDGEMLDIPQDVNPKGDSQESSAESQDDTDSFGGLPKSILLIKIGSIPFSKEGTDGTFDCSLDDLKAILQDFQNRGKDIAIDYNHGKLSEATVNGEAPAAGWIDSLEIDPKRGLIGKVKSYTPRAVELAKKKEIPRYISPALNFNDEYTRPTSLHSVGLTDTPSFHNPEMVMAANDQLSKAEKLQKRKSTIQSFKDLVSSMHKSHSDMGAAVLSTIQDYHTFVKDNTEDLHDMQTFNDSTLGSGVIAFADIQAEIFQKRDTSSGQQYVDWLMQRLQSAANDFEKSTIQDELNRLQEFKTKYPSLWEAGFTSGNEQTLKALEGGRSTATSGMTISDGNAGKTPLLFNDLGVKDETSASKKVKELSEFKSKGDEFLKQYGVKTFSDVSKVILDKNTKLFNDLKAKSQEASKASASLAVQKLLDDGRILGSQKDTFERLFVESPVTFNDLTKSLKPRIEKGYSDLLDTLKQDTEHKKEDEGTATEAQNKKAKAIGFRDYLEYRTKAKANGTFVPFND